MHITAASTISCQPTFRNKGFSGTLSELKRPSELVAPDYSAFIPVMERRRMSEILKMAITCAIDCLEQAGITQPEAIIVGTSLGCSHNTKHFLDNIIAANGGLISPTPFILSTHNSIAGQISIRLKNHRYNMTHTQNSLSFEQALIDGMLCLNDGSKNILVGAADELENDLYNMTARLETMDINFVCGASFFTISAENTTAQSINLVDVGSFGLVPSIADSIADFLQSNTQTAADIDLVLYAHSHPKTVQVLEAIFDSRKLFDYQIISGTYFTNSAFAMHYSIDVLQQENHPLFGQKINKVLICNNLIPENLGLILLERA